MKPFNPSVSLQKQFAPHSICFGCGPANQQGLQLESYLDQGAGPALRMSTVRPTTAESSDPPSYKLIADFQTLPHHTAFEGFVNGGILSVLLDCHLNWTAAWHLMLAGNLEVPPGCVTSKYEVTFQAPTPLATPLRLEAWIEEIYERKAIVSGKLGPVTTDQNGIQTVTASAVGTFVAVKPSHPAFRRW